MMKKKKEIMISSKKKTDIPNDLIIEIFSILPVNSLLRFRWVCKSWFNLISDPMFISMQLNNNINHKLNKNPLVLIYHYNRIQLNQKLNSYNIMDTDDDHALLCHNSLISPKVPFITFSQHSIMILGSCNGLLCIGVRVSIRSTSSFGCKRYFIWNPCTKEYKNVNENNGTYLGSRHGFGYDRTIDDYKLVKTAMGRGHNGNPETWVYVYTLGTNTWKTIRSSYEFILCSTKEESNMNGLFISGHLYYTAMKKSSRTFDIIVSFDIAKEEYGQIPFPDIRRDGFSDPDLKLGVLKGCLCLLSTLVGSSHIVDEVWMMRHNAENTIDVKEEYTWEKLCTFSTKRCWDSLTTKLLTICKNGEILMVKESICWKEIVLYDPKSNKITSLHKFSKEENVESNYMESLVSLNSGTYMM